MKFLKSIRRYGAIPIASGAMAVGAAFPAFAADTGTLTGTLSIFSEVFGWFLQEGGNLLAWMLDKPIILLSLAVFFVGSVIGVLSRIYSSF